MLYMNYELLTGIFLTLAVIISNIGAKFIHLDFDDRQHGVLSHPHVRIFYIFCMAFVGIRDFYYAGIITTIYYLLVRVL